MGFFSYFFGKEENENTNTNQPCTQTADLKCVDCMYCCTTDRSDENNETIFVCSQLSYRELGGESYVKWTPTVENSKACGGHGFSPKY